uniref:Tetratricopeptide repeat protein 39B n=1 Tax=Pundamilia nyererei TaxID=303518 RepID=A0A3B4FDQ8_9CICH
SWRRGSGFGSCSLPVIPEQAGSMDLQTAIQETQCALNLVLNNKFSQALDLLKPWDSMYHALGYSSILVMQATMTFEHRDIQTAMATIKEALHTCQSWKSVCCIGVFAGEMHAELCYAECLLQKATLTFVQVRNATQTKSYCFSICLQGFGLSQLREGASSHSLRSILCVLTLLFYHTYVSLILGRKHFNVFFLGGGGSGSIILFYSARIAALRGNFEKVCPCVFRPSVSQQEWKQIHHLCYWELMWTHSYQQEWEQAYQYADLLCKESRWSKAIYVYQKAAILSMMSEEELKKTGENVVELFRQVEGLKQRLAGKSIPTEKFAVRKSRRYKAANPIPLVIPLLEMMYVWNGFTIVGKRADCAESLLVTIEKAEEQLRNDPNPSEFHTDDSCLVQMLKGLCLKHLGRLLQAELCFTQVLSSEGRIRYDHYLIPFTLYELGLLYKQQGDFLKATTYIENAKTNYKDYSMESRLHFRIHAALNSLKGSPAGTP